MANETKVTRTDWERLALAAKRGAYASRINIMQEGRCNLALIGLRDAPPANRS